MGFCFAPRFHPAMRHAGPTRRELGVPTVFNFLGPLANPAQVRRQSLGVSDPKMAVKMAGVLQARGPERAFVVYGHDGLDEITTTTTSTVIEIRDGECRTYDIDPAGLGLTPADPVALIGGDAATNAGMARRVLDGQRGPQRDFVLLNAAAGIVVAGLADDLAAGLEAAAASIDEGRAASVLERMVKVSQEHAAAPARWTQPGRRPRSRSACSAVSRYGWATGRSAPPAGPDGGRPSWWHCWLWPTAAGCCGTRSSRPSGRTSILRQGRPTCARPRTSPGGRSSGPTPSCSPADGWPSSPTIGSPPTSTSSSGWRTRPWPPVTPPPAPSRRTPTPVRCCPRCSTRTGRRPAGTICGSGTWRCCGPAGCGIAWPRPTRRTSRPTAS